MNPGTRILIIGINYTPERTGIGRYTGDMGTWLADQDAKVQVITGYPYYPGWKVDSGYQVWRFRNEQLNGVKVLRCPLFVPRDPTPVRRIIQDLSFLFTSIIALTRLWLSRSTFDHIWVASPSFLSGWAGLWAGRLFPGAQRHLHVFDLPVDAAQALGMIRGRRLIGWLSKAESVMMKKYHRVSTLTNGMLERIIQKGVSRDAVCLLPIWVDTSRFQPMDSNPQLLRRFGIEEGRRIVLYSGAVGEKQGLESLLHLAGMVQSAGMDSLLFVIAGEGPYLQTLKRIVSDSRLTNVLFIPLLSEPAFPDMLNAAWLHMVLQRDTSGEHFMPSKLCTILSVGGLAMVTADPGSSLGKLVSNHQMAALVPENDPRKLFKQMLELLEKPEFVLKLKANAREYAIDQLSRDVILSTYWR
jgi:colanic acid biosynthesis glycosyl transferase WcaI